MNKSSSAVHPADVCPPVTQWACPSNFWRGIIVDVSCIPTMDEHISTVPYQLSSNKVQNHHLPRCFLTSPDVLTPRHNGRIGQECTASLSWSYTRIFANSSNALVISKSSMLDTYLVHKAYVLPCLSRGTIQNFVINNTNHHDFHPSSVGAQVNTIPYTVILRSDAQYRLPTIGWYVHYHTVGGGNTYHSDITLARPESGLPDTNSLCYPR
ncbi:hypothetical protein DFJ58DRAFT_219753 [Suillus subalutaceus]|uniref:uncharacterized protein n=1 Tax=Suillus subalutaceus TaxID=48586 RepID=UPI001B85F00D|nr:uncharacterized protein DFJ58DRAFT_219753 [Suillus subalutaceus]KAG1834057.1 hypothetical protein DFJ58DRAFT_219753 [Suillus subalutaceus]